MKREYDEMLFKIQKDDVVTTEKGTLLQHSITKEWFLVNKFKYLGKGEFNIIGKKEAVDVKELGKAERKEG